MDRDGVSMTAILMCCFCFFKLVVSSGRSNPVLTLCANTSFFSFGPGDHGTIEGTSNGPMSLSSPCTLTITTCSRCRIRLKFNQLDESGAWASTTGSPLFFFFSEPGYPDLYRYITPFNTVIGSFYESETRVLSIRYDGPRGSEYGYPMFSMDFETLEKSYTVQGPFSGDFKSLGFPNGYGPNGDTFIYHIINEDRNGYIKLTFSDWHLSPQCRIRILLSNSTIDASGSSPRPFVMSDGPRMTVEVYFATNVNSFTGFKAQYEFVTSRVWLEKPRIGGYGLIADPPDHRTHSDFVAFSLQVLHEGQVTALHGVLQCLQLPVDEFYYTSNVGGLLECNCRKYKVDGWADFLWVMMRSPLVNGNSSRLLLRLMQPTLLAGDVLEIRKGNNSNGELLGWSRPADYYDDSDALYIRLRMRCSTYRNFKAMYIWVQSLSSSYLSDSNCVAPYNYRCVRDGYCISPSLVCDDVRHCSDGSDEFLCNRPTERIPNGCYAFFRCEDGRQTVCEARRCNGRPDCDDLSDEAHCADYPVGGRDPDDPYRGYTMLATVVPVAVGSVITFVVVCAVIGFVLQRKRQVKALRRVRQIVRDQAAIAPVGFSDEEDDLTGMACQSMMTGLPSYEETVTFHSEVVAADDTFSPPPYSAVNDKSIANKNTSETAGASCSLLPPTYDVATTGQVDCSIATYRDPLIMPVNDASDGSCISTEGTSATYSTGRSRRSNTDGEDHC